MRSGGRSPSAPYREFKGLAEFGCIYNKSMIYAWDETKNRANRQKHGLDFADAARVFESAPVTFEDDRADYDE